MKAPRITAVSRNSGCFVGGDEESVVTCITRDRGSAAKMTEKQGKRRINLIDVCSRWLYNLDNTGGVWYADTDGYSCGSC